MQSLRAELRALPVLSSVPRPFDVNSAPATPQELFVDWFRQAVDAGEAEPHAMTLSTCDALGRPDARVLILKDLDEQGWWFATSSASTKGQQLEQRPTAALTFYWRTLGRQVRVRGTVLTASDERAAADFRARGLGARAVALASRESQPLADPSECREAVQVARAALEAHPGLVSPNWALYSVNPDQVEFWQADPDRQHARLRYAGSGSRWVQTLLWP
ncbi:pyridoxine/pyridoxamine 5'-phosphate oxidase [Nocardioides sp. Soil805]|uniref:pyridoxine/pyridoxamine 5'-phosphate oxidase n=1 Tax=Nocardioides sp. Soil805 TaxID=1736416 RepID=UPI0012E35C6A|nr:pyridoxal 5'-phosphate synthase [Nocardioides sp. Soil805]